MKFVKNLKCKNEFYISKNFIPQEKMKFTPRFFVDNSVIAFDDKGDLMYFENDKAKSAFNALKINNFYIIDVNVNTTTSTIVVVYKQILFDKYMLKVFPISSDCIYTSVEYDSQLHVVYNNGTDVGFYYIRERTKNNLQIVLLNLSTIQRKLTDSYTHKIDSTKYIDVIWNYISEKSSDLSNFTLCFADDNLTKTFAKTKGKFRDATSFTKHENSDNVYGIKPNGDVVRRLDLEPSFTETISKKMVTRGAVRVMPLYAKSVYRCVNGHHGPYENTIRVEQVRDDYTLLSDTQSVYLYKSSSANFICLFNDTNVSKPPEFVVECKFDESRKSFSTNSKHVLYNIKTGCVVSDNEIVLDDDIAVYRRYHTEPGYASPDEFYMMFSKARVINFQNATLKNVFSKNDVYSVSIVPSAQNAVMIKLNDDVTIQFENKDIFNIVKKTERKEYRIIFDDTHAVIEI